MVFIFASLIGSFSPIVKEVYDDMILKSTVVLSVLVLLCLTIFAAATFSINHTIDAVWKEPRSCFKNDGHSGLVPIGDPVPGGGTPCGGNQTSNDTV